MRGLGAVLVGALVVAIPAEAGPWARDAGGFYVRGLVSAETLGGLDGMRADTYGEYGLTDRLTLTGKTEAVFYEDSIGAIDRQSYRVSLRRQLWSRKGFTFGAEAGAVYGNAIAGTFGCDEWGGEARVSGGYSGVRKSLGFYLFSDVALISHQDGCLRRRAEFGYGADVSDPIFVTQQVWLERSNDSADLNKFESQVGYHFGHFDVSVGYREEFGGIYEENAYLIALATRR
ncbi:MAG: hypothetical protein VR74_18135 [Hyphomonas sp. BRH_c22]|uniref:hypothetical protein n=1 Tax=Hyphomonas sp. BRH_c22 TaxID=1629710 RepID=UPI0005F124B2|nr:hypothetical protein [Hyphomonas sp. BRH_c22]KJS35071.1 MAG: hypothetical protein VR74_18135 [Hyphomonas sp. BRH_c22]